MTEKLKPSSVYIENSPSYIYDEPPQIIQQPKSVQKQIKSIQKDNKNNINKITYKTNKISNSFSAVLIISVMFVFGIIIGILFYNWYKGKYTPKTQQQPGLNQLIQSIQQKSSWTQSVQVDNSSRGGCNVYTFSVTNPTTYDKATVDAITPNQFNSGCTNSNQIYAQLVEHTCQGGGANGFGCTGANGETFQPGQSEQYYIPCDIPKCQASNINFVMIPHYVTNVPNAVPQGACLTKDGNTYIAKPCSQSDTDQYMTTIRLNPDGKPDNKGLFLAMINNNDSTCIGPDGSDYLTEITCPANPFKWLIIPSNSIGTCNAGFIPVDTTSIPTIANPLEIIVTTASPVKTYKSSSEPLASGYTCYQHTLFNGSTCLNPSGCLLMDKYDPAKVVPQQIIYLSEGPSSINFDVTNPSQTSNFITFGGFKSIQIEQTTGKYKLLPLKTNTLDNIVTSDIVDIYAFGSLGTANPTDLGLLYPVYA